MENFPRHIALIPDGNRRWAKRRFLKPWIGHQKGAKAFEKILEKTIELGIPYLTFWAGSYDNLTKRSKRELNFLFKVYAEQFKRILTDKRIRENQIKVNFLGRWKEILPKEIQSIIQKVIKSTQEYKNFFLTFLLAYNGTDEMLTGIKKIANLVKDKKIRITPKLIKENLRTKDLPPVDLIIRTGCEGDPHNSAGFMMWDTAYSQFYFTKTLFPDFSPKEFEKIIKDYSKRERRFGT